MHKLEEDLHIKEPVNLCTNFLPKKEEKKVVNSSLNKIERKVKRII